MSPDLCNEIEAIWLRRDELVYDHGTAKPFTLIYGKCLRIPGIVRQFVESTVYMPWFDVGNYLGQSSGYCQEYFDGTGRGESCWDYRRREELQRKLGELGMTLIELSGLPDTDTPKAISAFFSTLPMDSETMQRYPIHRWGWAFIEVRLQVLRSTATPIQQATYVGDRKPMSESIDSKLIVGGVEPGRVPNQNEVDLEPRFEFRPSGDGYFIRGFGESGHFTARGAKGLHDLYRLVQTPSIPVSMLELDAGRGVKRQPGDAQSRQAVGDGGTFADIKAKWTQLKADINEADSELERRELQEQLNQLEKATKAMRGLKGNPRDINNSNDKNRSRIHDRIETACKAITNASCKQLATHFKDNCSAEGQCYVYKTGIADMKWDTERKQ